MSELSRAELDDVFDAQILPRYDALLGDVPRGADAAVTDADAGGARPRLLLVGGQPGAGKTQFLAIAGADAPGAIEVVGDDLRAFHPDCARLMSTDPLAMPAATQQAAGAWVHASLDHLRSRGAGVLMETTLRDPAAVMRTLTQFSGQGYLTELRVLAVPAAVSRLGTLARYADQVREHGTGRWAPSSVHDVAYEAAAQTATEAIAAGVVSRVVVQQRGQVALFDHTVGSADRAAVAAGAAAAILDGRRIDRMPVSHARGWMRDAERLVGFVAEAGIDDPDIRNTVVRVGGDAGNIAAAAWPNDDVARAVGTERVVSAVARVAAADPSTG